MPISSLNRARGLEALLDLIGGGTLVSALHDAGVFVPVNRGAAAKEGVGHGGLGGGAEGIAPPRAPIVARALRKGQGATALNDRMET